MQDNQERIANFLSRMHQIMKVDKSKKYVYNIASKDLGKFSLIWQLLRIEGFSEVGLNYVESFIEYIECKIRKIEKLNKCSIQESALTRKEQDGISHSTVTASSCTL